MKKRKRDLFLDGTLTGKPIVVIEKVQMIEEIIVPNVIRGNIETYIYLKYDSQSSFNR